MRTWRKLQSSTLFSILCLMLSRSWQLIPWLQHQGNMREKKAKWERLSLSSWHIVWAILRHPNNLWLTVNMLPWCSTDKVKNSFTWAASERERESWDVSSHWFEYYWKALKKLLKNYTGKARKYMHIITPPWMEGQHTIWTSPCHLMFYAHTNELPHAEIVQVMCLFIGRSH